MIRKKPEIKSYENLEAAFAGESMAHQRYNYFTKLARNKGAEDVAKLFEDTAKHETAHAEGHMRFLYPEDELSVRDLLQIAIDGETYEYTEMYPKYEKVARDEGNEEMVNEFKEQQRESIEHAENFKKKLGQIAKAFNSLTKVEEKHAKNYKDALENI